MPPRPDLFTQIHKGIRSLLYDLGSHLQTTDFSSRESCAPMLERLKNDLGLLHEHGVHEDTVYFPPLKAHEGEVVHLMTDEHAEIGSKIGAVKAAVQAVSDAADAETMVDRGVKLNRVFNHFAAYYLRHMNHEEETAMPAMWRHFSDEELIAMRTKVQSSIPPPRYAEWLRWMLPSLNEPELIGILGAVKASALPHILQGVVSVAEQTLEPERWNSVRRKAGV